MDKSLRKEFAKLANKLTDEEKREFAKKVNEQKIEPTSYWSKDLDPNFLAGDEWVDSDKEIGNDTLENQELMEGIPVQGYPFNHPEHNITYDKTINMFNDEK